MVTAEAAAAARVCRRQRRQACDRNNKGDGDHFHHANPSSRIFMM
jgi:hypothetical protein